MSIIYPPHIASTIPAFVKGESSTSIKIPFTNNSAVVGWSGLFLVVHDLQNNKIATSQYTGGVETISQNPETKMYEVAFTTFTFEEGQEFNQGQYYKMQIAYIDSEDIDKKNNKLKESFNPYFSSASIGRCILPIEAGVTVSGLIATGTVTPHEDLKSEVPYQYRFRLGDIDNPIKNLTEWENFKERDFGNDGKATVTYTINDHSLFNKQLYVWFETKTINGYEISKSAELGELNYNDSPMQGNITISPTVNYDEGYTELSISGIDESAYENIDVVRALEDSDTWETIYSFSGVSEISCLDKIAESGLSYKYGLIGKKNDGTYNYCFEAPMKTTKSTDKQIIFNTSNSINFYQEEEIKTNIEINSISNNLYHGQKVPPTRQSTGIICSYDPLTGILVADGKYTKAGNTTLGIFELNEFKPNTFYYVTLKYLSGSILITDTYFGYPCVFSFYSYIINENGNRVEHRWGSKQYTMEDVGRKIQEDIVFKFKTSEFPETSIPAGEKYKLFFQGWPEDTENAPYVFDNFRVQIQIEEGEEPSPYQLGYKKTVAAKDINKQINVPKVPLLYTSSNDFFINEYSNEYLTPYFEDTFLIDGKRQLKIRFNPKVSSFKETLIESKQDTIGGKYPFFFRNGDVRYKEIPISGLISYQMDDNQNFMSDKELGLDSDVGLRRGATGANNYAALKTRTTSLADYNIAAERKFKIAVLEWLNNGKPKLFKSPTEGNYIVRLMNVSLTPEDKLGRMIHSFSATGYECMDINEENLRELGITKTNTTVNGTATVATFDLRARLIPDPIYFQDFGTVYSLSFSGDGEVQISYNKPYKGMLVKTFNPIEETFVFDTKMSIKDIRTTPSITTNLVSSRTPKVVATGPILDDNFYLDSSTLLGEDEV